MKLEQRLLDIIRKIEFRINIYQEGRVIGHRCPYCNRLQPYHDTECEIKKVLAENPEG
jgi:uncharacterized OB-fold protein